MTFTIIIPTCERPAELAECLRRIRPSGPRSAEVAVEVLVCDDGASSVREMLARDFPWARWIAGPRRGPAANRNHGAAQAKGEWLVFLDDDCLPAPSWLAAYAAASQTSGADVLEGRTCASDVRRSIDTESPINTSGGFLWSCNFAIRRARFDQLGGFDEGFPAPAMEDVDFRTRLLKQKIPFVFVPDAEVGHPWRPRKGRAFVRVYARSVEFFLTRHPDQAAPYRLPALARRLVGQAWRNMRDGVRDCGGRGVARAVGLELYTFLQLARMTARRRS